MKREQADAEMSVPVFLYCNKMSESVDNMVAYRAPRLLMPDGSNADGQRILLHSCCAPCSAAIVECMLSNGMRPTVYFSNSNIYPHKEYEIRKSEIIRFLKEQGVPFVEDSYDHDEWLREVKGYEGEPERGQRCSLCFEFRLRKAADYASENGFKWLTTTLASSRWKNIQQINEAGIRATVHTQVLFLQQNWRKGGLQERRNELLRQNAFYNQQYCGCEYSATRLKDFL